MSKFLKALIACAMFTTAIASNVSVYGSPATKPFLRKGERQLVKKGTFRVAYSSITGKFVGVYLNIDDMPALYRMSSLGLIEHEFCLPSSQADFCTTTEEPELSEDLVPYFRFYLLKKDGSMHQIGEAATIAHITCFMELKQV